VNRRRAGTFEDAARRVLESIPAAERSATEHVLARLGTELRAISDGTP
jgi:hypothetical protein